MKKWILKLSIVMLVFLASWTSLSAASLQGYEQFNNVVIFIRFADETNYQAPFNYQYYDDLFNDTDGPSLRDYYLEVSYGQLTIDSYLTHDNTTILFYTDTHERSYYEPFDATSNPDGYTSQTASMREQSLLRNASIYVEEQGWIDDSIDLDVNDDGEIDSITFLISGEDNGWNTLLWPHKWELYMYYDDRAEVQDSNAPSINGAYVNNYMVELLGISASYDYKVDVYVLAHETFHLIGAPDLYHYYTYLNIDPTGEWGLMESYSTDIPSHMLGYMKEEYGLWIDDTPIISESGTYTLSPQSTTGEMYKIDTGYENEWIYLEYRDGIGEYETTLPGTGLLVYRVNQNIDGNVYGSYASDGTPLDEVWVFRPGMSDMVERIILEDTDVKEVDGFIDAAALSDDNFYSEAGPDTDILLFSSEGYLLDIFIDNVYEHDGVITFDVTFPMTLQLRSTTYDLENKDVVLWDNYNMNYMVDIEYWPSAGEVRYTTDGSTPTIDSPLFPENGIEVTAEGHVITAGIFEDGQLTYTTQETYTFMDEIESSHYPYEDNLNQYFYIDFGTEVPFNITFSSFSELEAFYDYLILYEADTTRSYTGTEMRLLDADFLQQEFLIEFRTDESNGDYYGFKATITGEFVPHIILQGDATYDHEVMEEFVDPGVVMNYLVDGYYIDVTSDVNAEEIGSYSITYDLVDPDGNIVETLTRLVFVEDTIDPEIQMDEDILYVELGDEFETPTYDVTDNYDTDITLNVTGFVPLTSPGEYKLYYSATDSSGNRTSATLTVVIQDTTKPTITLLPGVDTIYAGEEWEDAGVDIEDNSYTSLSNTITGSVDTTTPGTYVISYSSVDTSMNKTIETRYVTVLEQTVYEDVTCDAMVTTGNTKDDLQLFDCYVGDQIMTIDESAIGTTQGMYAVSYELTIDGVTYQQYIYVFIFGTNSINSDAIIERREDYV